MLKQKKLLCIEVTSREVIDAVYKFSARKNVQLALLCNPEQINYKGGILFETAEFVEYCEKLSNHYGRPQVYFYRNNCGPLEPNKIVTRKLIEDDVKQGFHYIHLDASRLKMPRNLKIDTLVNWIYLIESLNKKVKTEVSIDTAESIISTETLEHDVKAILAKFPMLPAFYRTHIGLATVNGFQVGNADLKQLKEIYTNLGYIGLKTYNTEFIGNPNTFRAITKYLDSVNVETQCGIVQTSYLLSQCLIYGIIPKSFYELVFKTWKDKVNEALKANVDYLIRLFGFYHFNSLEYQDLYDSVEDCNPNFRDELVREHCKLIHYYYGMLN